MKVYFVFEFTNKPSGGVFQFIKALKEQLAKTNNVTNNPDEADIFFISASQFPKKILYYKKKYSNKLFIHRIDGPIRLYNKMSDRRDLIVNLVNKYIADGTIFQSYWSKEKNIDMGLILGGFHKTILNAPDANIFNRYGKSNFNKNKKTKLIATSWSNNLKKGFDVYLWLDKNLDFDRYEMTFVGNSPYKFKNIVHKKPMDSKKLSLELKQHDIFITASQKDPCSNSLIESMHCGLPAIGLDDGGHTQIIGKGGELFRDQTTIPQLIEKVVDNYDEYVSNIDLPNIDEVTKEYLEFLETIHKKQQNDFVCKKLSWFDQIYILCLINVWKVEEKLYNLKNRLLR